MKRNIVAQVCMVACSSLMAVAAVSTAGQHHSHGTGHDEVQEFAKGVFQKLQTDPYGVTTEELLKAFEANVMETEQLTDNLYVLRGNLLGGYPGGNLALLVGEDGNFLVDNQMEVLGEQMMAEIAKITDQPIDYVFNTHWHIDHAGGNLMMGKNGSVIVAHDTVRQRLKNGRDAVSFQPPIVGHPMDPQPKEALPTITFGKEMTFHLNGEEIQVIHFTNAHTDGDAVAYFRTSNIIHVGDLISMHGAPWMDSSSGGDINGMIESQTAIIELINDETKVITGHGPIATRTDMIKSRDATVDIRDRVQATIDAGKSLEDAVASKPLSGIVSDGGFHPADDTVRDVYLMLTEKKQ